MSRKTLALGSLIAGLLVVIAVLLAILLLRGGPIGLVTPIPVPVVTPVVTPTLAPTPEILAVDTFTLESIPQSSLAYNLPNYCFDARGRLYLQDQCGAATRTLDNGVRIFDADTWDLSASLTPIADNGVGNNDRFAALTSSRDDSSVGNDTLGIGTRGGGFSLLVPGFGDSKSIVLGETYKIGSTYQLTLNVTPDPAKVGYYLVNYRVTNVLPTDEVELLKGQISVEQPFGVQTSARYDQLTLTGGDPGNIITGNTATKFNNVSLVRQP